MTCALLMGVTSVPLRAAPKAWQQRPAADPRPVFSAGVELVVFNVAVLDDDGDPVTDLSMEDFVVHQAGEAQDITLFASPEDSFLDVALVLDTSGSIAQSAPRIREDAMRFLSALGERDCVYFVPFRGTVGEPLWASPGDARLAASIGGVDLSGGTALYDALVEGLTNVHRSRGVPAGGEGAAANWEERNYDGLSCGAPLPPPSLGIPGTVRRTAVVVLSDGGDEHSLASFVETMGAVWADPVPIFAVAIGDAVPPQSRGALRPGSRRARVFRRRYDVAESLTGRLEKLARISGGRLIFGREEDALGESFATAVEMLRSSYLLGYRPPADDPGVGRSGMVWHPVQLDVPRRDVEMFTRPGYYQHLVDTPGARRIVRETLQEVLEGSPEAALQQLDLAVMLDPGYWPVYLQRARTWLRLDERERARDDMLRALALRPGTLAVHTLLAGTAYNLGEYELAWQQGIRAHQGGAQITTLLRALETVAEPPADLQTQLRASRAFVDLGGVPDELDQGTLVEILRTLRQAVSDAPDLALIAPWNVADVGIILEVEDVGGTPRRLRGELVLTNAPYMSWEDENVVIEDIDDPASVADAIERALRKARDLINELR